MNSNVERVHRDALTFGHHLRRKGEGEEFDAFVNGGADEAEEFFGNEGKPVHCLSTRFGGVNYRVSMLIGDASACGKR